MKPFSFEYYAPQTVEEAVRLLASGGLEARVLAGGQSLMPMLNMRLARPARVVDINGIAALNYIKTDDDCLRVGALARHADLLRNPEVRRGWPLLAEAVAFVGHPAIRNRGTVCGSISHADPASEQPCILMAMDGIVTIAGASGRREVPAREFFVTMMTTAVEPGEMVVEVRYPRLPAGTGSAFIEFGRRHGDFAIVGVAATLTMERDVCRQARLCLVGVADTPFRAEAAEAAITGHHFTAASSEQVFAAAAAAVQSAIEPAEDIHGSSSYRRHLAGALTERALRSAMSRVNSAGAGGNQLG